jgi:uncharacterized membrane protein YeiH
VSLLAWIIKPCFPSAVRQQSNPVLLFDAAGLARFAVSGAYKALADGLNPIMATLLAMVNRDWRRHGARHFADGCAQRSAS